MVSGSRAEVRRLDRSGGARDGKADSQFLRGLAPPSQPRTARHCQSDPAQLISVWAAAGTPSRDGRSPQTVCIAGIRAAIRSMTALLAG